MPPKVRELVNQLLAAGFIDRGGKGSHRNFRHPAGVNITISGKPSDDARHYQIRDVKQAIEWVQREK
jgi:predicted RNA binding protein YcfA (HicA-like mRNA interferase family)